MTGDQMLMWFLGQLIAGAAIWGGIRADIRGMHKRLEINERAMTEAHTRIDRILETRK